jgi:hypothetical protein
VLIDEHRDWGWRIVNYGKYRDIRDEEARRLSNRSYKRMQRQRERQLKSDGVLDSQLMSGSVSAGQSKSAHTEAEAEAEADKKESSLRSPKKVRNESAPQPTPATVIQKFQAMPAYAALNVRHEWDRMSAWCITNRKQPSEKRFCNWLLRAEVPLNGHSPPMDRHEANKLKRQELVFQRLIEEGIVKP